MTWTWAAGEGGTLRGSIATVLLGNTRGLKSSKDTDSSNYLHLHQFSTALALITVYHDQFVRVKCAMINSAADTKKRQKDTHSQYKRKRVDLSIYLITLV